MTCNDKDLFKEAMEDVKPLKETSNVVFCGLNPQVSSVCSQRSRTINFLITKLQQPIPCDTPLSFSFKQDGIQQGVLDKLGRGKYMIDASLNLTRMPVARCRELLFEFIYRMEHENIRTLLIIHGKGRHDGSHANIVRSFVTLYPGREAGVSQQGGGRIKTPVFSAFYCKISSAAYRWKRPPASGSTSSLKRARWW